MKVHPVVESNASTYLGEGLANPGFMVDVHHGALREDMER
jgi:hypothetical protein